MPSLVAQRLSLKASQYDGNNVWTYSGDGPYVDEGSLFGTPALMDAARERTVRGVSAGHLFGFPAITFMRFGK